MPDDLQYQELTCDIVLGRTVEACVLADVPMIFMLYPKLVYEWEYCYERLRWAWSIAGLVPEGDLEKRVCREHKRLARPDMVHVYYPERSFTLITIDDGPMINREIDNANR